jgi:hypothetical protein
MAKTQIEVDSNLFEKIRPLAIANGVKPTIQNLVNLSLKVATDMYQYLDDTDFENISNLKK